MAKSAVFCGFGQIYWRNPLWKTSFFVHYIMSLIGVVNFSKNFLPCVSQTPIFLDVLKFHWKSRKVADNINLIVRPVTLLLFSRLLLSKICQNTGFPRSMFFLIRKNVDQGKPTFRHILCSACDGHYSPNF